MLQEIKYVEAKNNLLINVENFYKGRKKIIEGFKNKIFPLYYNEAYEHQMKAQRQIEEQEEQEEQKPTKVDYKTFIKQIVDEEKDFNDEIFKKYFKVQRPSDLLMFLKKQMIQRKKMN